MAAIGSVLGALWPRILGGVMTGLLIYLSLRGMGRSRGHLPVLKWRAVLDEPTGQKTKAANQRLEG